MSGLKMAAARILHRVRYRKQRLRSKRFCVENQKFMKKIR